MLFVLVGARGAGKTTLLGALKKSGVDVLQPSTTRLQRFAGESEYEFVTNWHASDYAWRIEIGSHTYGMRKSEVNKAIDKTCTTVFDPLNLHVFEGVRKSLSTETMTVGLNTISSIADQHSRVGNDPNRMMDEASLAQVSKIVAECDVVLSGDSKTVADALLSLVGLISERGGVVTKDYLAPMMKAGAILTGSQQENIRTASYDLRIGAEILCQGKVTELTDSNPRLEIPPYSYAIVSALEIASLPPCIVGRFDLKVSSFFEGLILSNGPQVDPGYKGALFCMLYNCNGQPKLLTLGKHFATIDFTTTTVVTEGYKQKYQLKQRMGQFLTDGALAGRGGAIVELVDEKIDVVDGKVRAIQKSFWAIAAAVLTFAVAAPALTVPILWSEINKINDERIALTAERTAISEAQKRTADLLTAAEQERAEIKRILTRSTRIHEDIMKAYP